MRRTRCFFSSMFMMWIWRVCACVLYRIALLYLLMVCWLAGTSVLCTLIYLIHLFGDWTIYPPDDRRTSCCCCCCCSCTHLACAWHFLAKFFMAPKNWCSRSSSSSRRAEVFFFSTALLTHQRASAICLFVCSSFSLSLLGSCTAKLTRERERERTEKQKGCWQSWCWRDAEKMQRGEKEKESHYDMSDRGEKRTWRWWPLTRCTNSLARTKFNPKFTALFSTDDGFSFSLFLLQIVLPFEGGRERGGGRTTNLHLHVC